MIINTIATAPTIWREKRRLLRSCSSLEIAIQKNLKINQVK
jgi:hypothetical protein